MSEPDPPALRLAAGVAVAALAFGLMFFSNPSPEHHYDYTTRMAGALLRGHLGVSKHPPSWLNEMIPHEGRPSSAFPLGSVLSMVPLAAMERAGWIKRPPVRLLIASIAAAATAFAFLLTGVFALPLARSGLLALTPVFATCLWPNLAYGGAWQIALGFAVLGELGALYFLLGPRRRPLLAGFFFALAFGNRTEILLTAPLFYYLLLRGESFTVASLLRRWLPILCFSIVPVILGVLTLAYNDARFGSPFDFGYARIPGVLDEPEYAHGIFSLHAIPRNAWQMLLAPPARIDHAPWLIPSGWGGSLLLYSPFLLLLVRRGARDADVKTTAWIAIAVLTAVLWLHGNPGGWQVSYRYAAILMPWAFLILLESSRRASPRLESTLIIASILINACATWIFCNTSLMEP